MNICRLILPIFSEVIECLSDFAFQDQKEKAGIHWLLLPLIQDMPPLFKVASLPFQAAHACLPSTMKMLSLCCELRFTWNCSVKPCLGAEVRPQ